MFCLKSIAIRTALLALLFSLSASMPVLAWDTQVYVRNCNTGDAVSDGFHAYNGGDMLCAVNATFKEIGFTESGKLECDEVGTGNCKIGVFSTHRNCADKVSVGDGNTLLVYDVSGKEIKYMTASSPDVNCCAMTPGVGDGDCATYLEECADNGINGAACLMTYVPCRAGGSDAATCGSRK